MKRPPRSQNPHQEYVLIESEEKIPIYDPAIHYHTLTGKVLPKKIIGYRIIKTREYRRKPGIIPVVSAFLDLFS